MAYATGTAATSDALLAAIQTFASGQGWTVNYSGVDGVHTRLHISKAGVFANFSSNYVPGTYIFGLQGSSGWIGSGSAWNAQTAPLATVRTCPLQVNGNNILPCTYHLFAQTAPDTLAGVFVSATNDVTYFMVGNISKIGTYAGGDFYSADDTFQYAGSAATPASSFADLKTAGAFIVPYFFGTQAGVDTGNNQSPLMPLRLFENVTNNYKPRGVVQWARVLGRNYANGDELTYGADVWKVFYSSGPTSRYMVAFKK